MIYLSFKLRSNTFSCLLFVFETLGCFRIGIVRAANLQASQDIVDYYIVHILSMSRLTSYFPTIVQSLRKTVGNDYYNSVSQRPSDFYIMEHQNPVGWKFFSHNNVSYLIQKARKCKSTADFADISEHMIHVYEVYASETSHPLPQLQIIVERLNDLFVQRFVNHCEILRKNIYDYNKFLAQPNQVVPHPTLERDDRTIRIDRRNYLL